MKLPSGGYASPHPSGTSKIIAWCLAVGAIGYALLPWYAVQDSLLSPGWLEHYIAKDNAPALLQITLHGRTWLLPIAALLVIGAPLVLQRIPDRLRARGLIVIGSLGLLYFLAQGFAIGPQGWNLAILARALGPLSEGQYGWGIGAMLTALSFALLFAVGLAEHRRFGGDAFVAASVVLIAGSVALFTFF